MAWAWLAWLRLRSTCTPCLAKALETVSSCELEGSRGLRIVDGGKARFISSTKTLRGEVVRAAAKIFLPYLGLAAKLSFRAFSSRT